MTTKGKRLDATRSGGRAAALDQGLRRLIVGQDDAVRQIVNIYQMYLTGLAPANRPIGNLLFPGPTGSGKTRTVEAAAEILLGSSRAVIKVDCGEFQHSHEIAKLIGSPPGYLGHRETMPLLCQENLSRHYTAEAQISLVLFDEIEKASDAVWNLLLGILDKATLTLGDNRRVDFSNCLIFMTSNLGSAEIGALTRPGLGFSPPAAAPEGLSGKIAAAGMEAARRKFTPEFINRLDKVVVFNPLGEGELRRVLDIELDSVQQRIFTTCAAPFGFRLTDAAKERVLAHGADVRYGARHLKRAIERMVVHPLSNLVASEQVTAGDRIAVDFDGEQMVFVKEAEQISKAATVSAARRKAGAAGLAASSAADARAKSWGSTQAEECGFGE